ncbi:hypothetical protein PSPO_b0882 [Pseudoalteromonas spongiae UST010723-006]|nr:hypothetical protein PSPO_b0882 [Pseudoalteromonas spongiae UST010723-006]
MASSRDNKQKCKIRKQSPRKRYSEEGYFEVVEILPDNYLLNCKIHK